MMIPRKSYSSRHRDLSNRVYASDEARAEAMERAENLESGLGSDHPIFVKTMLPSHVSGGFWLVNKSLYMLSISPFSLYHVTFCVLFGVALFVLLKSHMF